VDRKHQAEARLEAALATAGLEDSRPALRSRLKQLRAADQTAFDRVVRRYDDEIVPALAEAPAPLDAWLDFARTIGELTGAGQLVAIDASGRAGPYTAPYHTGDVVLHLPDNADTPALAAALPQVPSAPQQAALDLLLLGRLGS
jgi:hypothetical protein